MAIAFPRQFGFVGASPQPLAAGLREFRQSTWGLSLAELAGVLYAIIDGGTLVVPVDKVER
jgi:hypothetical protein